MIFLCRNGLSIDDRGLPDVQPFKWSSMKPNGHPAEKPIDLMRFLIENSSKAGDLIVDPFMGSGTTGAAALEIDRRFVGFETDPQWFDVACKRLENVKRQEPLFV